ncbi:MAG: hydrogenase maturation nickel metallochaperone HypA [Promethearchaeota archaeon]
MHEYSIAFEIIDIAEKLAEEHQRPVRQIEVTFGAFSLANKDQLLFWFDILSKEKPILKNAKFHFTDTPGVIQCNECGYNGPTSVPEENTLSHVLPIEFLIVCPKCGAKNTTIIDGMDIVVKEVILS